MPKLGRPEPLLLLVSGAQLGDLERQTSDPALWTEILGGTKGVNGGGFIYTNLDTVAADVAEQLEGMAKVLRGDTTDPEQAWLEVAREVFPDALRLRELFEQDQADRGQHGETFA